MARYTDKGINGTVGPVVLYTMNGQQYMRSKPSPRPRRKQPSPGTVATTSIFGLVSTCGSDMMGAVRNRFLYPFRLATYNTVRGWMRNQYAYYHQAPEWKLVVNGGDMYQLNREANLAGHLRTNLSVTDTGMGKIELFMDALDPRRGVKAPKGTTAVNIKAVAAATAFDKNHYHTVVAEEQWLVPYSQQMLPPKKMLLDTGAQAGDIAIVLVAVEYCTGHPLSKDYSKELRNLPVAIVAMGRLNP